MVAHITVQRQLVASAIQVVGGILDFIISITIDVVGKETGTLHEREKCYSIRQQVYLNRLEETMRRFKISNCERLEYVFVETYARDVGVVLSSEISTCAQEVTIILEDERWHHCIEIYHT